MRKYDKKNRISMLLIAILSIGLIVIFSLFINKVIVNGKVLYEIDKGSILYDKDKNIIKLDNDASVKIKWNDMYYLMYNDDIYMLGANSIIYNPMKSQMNLYGKFYEITAKGEDQVIIHEDETIVKTHASKFYKIADRKYLIVDSSIKSENNQINTKNYLIVELDKQGNATLYNNEINVKTFSPTNIKTSSYTLNIAEEKLLFSDTEIDLKKIIGSTNTYVKEEEISKEEDSNNTITDNNSNNQNNVNNNQNNNVENNNNNIDNNTDDNNKNIKDNVEKIPKTKEEQEKENSKQKIIKATKTTSIISITPSVGYVSIDYVIYDPLDEYESVYAQIYDSNNNLVSVYYLDKTTNNLIITGLKVNVTYNVKFKYNYIKDGKRVEEEFDKASFKIGTPSISLKVDKVTMDRIYYTVYLDKDFVLDSFKANITSGSYNDSNSINVSKLDDKNVYSGYFTYDDNVDKYATIYLSDIIYNGYIVDSKVSYKIAMP